MTKARTPAEIEEICRLYQNGQSCKTIALQVGMTDVGVHCLLRRHGIQTRNRGDTQPRRKMSPEVTAKAAEIYASGKSLREAAAAVGATAVAVRRALLNQGYDTRHKTRKKEWTDVEQQSGKLLCTDCGELKDPLEFNRPGARTKTKRGRAYVCKECQRWRTRELRYGITRGEYEDRLVAQGGRCKTCRKPWVGDLSNPDLVVDHDHATGEVRGLLCPRCNQALGLIQDDMETARRFVLYLECRGNI